MSKTYLGDGVYAEWDGLGLTLTTENGIATTNRIVLEPAELIALLTYLRGIPVGATPLLDLLIGRSR